MRNLGGAIEDREATDAASPRHDGYRRPVLRGPARPPDRHLSRISQAADPRGRRASRPQSFAAEGGFPRNPYRRRRDRDRGARLAGGFAFDPGPTRFHHHGQGPARDRAALGSDAPPASSWSPGPHDDRHFGRGLRALGPQGQGIRTADLADPGWGDPRQRPRLRFDARLRGRGHGPREGTRARLPGERLYRAEMVHPPRPDERPRGHEKERRA